MARPRAVLRAALAVVGLAVAAPASLYVHERHVWRGELHTLRGDNAGFLVAGEAGVYHHRVRVHPSWEDPAALAIAAGGAAIGLSTLTLPRRRGPRRGGRPRPG